MHLLSNKQLVRIYTLKICKKNKKKNKKTLASIKPYSLTFQFQKKMNFIRHAILG